MVPYLGWAQEVDQTAPSWLWRGGVSCCTGVSCCGDLLRRDLPFQGFCETVLVTFDFEDFDRLVGGAGCEAPAVVVEDCIVLLVGRD